MIHFGVNIPTVKYSHKINRDEYAIINNKSSIGSFFQYLFDGGYYEYYSDSFILAYLQLVIKTLSAVKCLDNTQHYRLEQSKKLYNDISKNFNSNSSSNSDITKTQMTIEELKMRYNLDKSIFGEFYSDAWCQQHYINCLKNFDLNMNYFRKLDAKEFNDEIENFIKQNKRFNPIKSLDTLKNKSGFYIMILDEYKSAYIGQSYDIYKRIRNHWTRRKPFDRLLLPQDNVENSIMSIDSFRALDTSRIFVRTCSKRIFENLLKINYEDKLISNFNQKFLLNRIAGGLNPSPLDYKERESH